MTDILIIGGGVAGLSAGARLSEIAKVTLLERETDLGYHTSGRSAALFEADYGKPTTVALNQASRAYHQEAGILSPRGLLLVGSPETADAFRDDCKEMHLDEIDLKSARQMIPILDPARIDRAAHDGDAWDMDTDLLLQSYVRTVRQHGGQIVTGAEVIGISPTRTGWRVTTSQGEYEAAVVVNAAGAWADQVAQMAGIAPVGLTPMRRSMARIETPGGHDPSNWPMLFGPGEAWYAKPDAGAMLVSPADEDPVAPMDAWAEDMVLAEGIALYQDHITPEVTRMISNWAGLRTFAPDRQLVLGPDPETPGFVWCAGQGGYGMMSSPAAGQLLADLIGGRTPEIGAKIAAGLSPARLRP